MIAAAGTGLVPMRASKAVGLKDGDDLSQYVVLDELGGDRHLVIGAPATVLQIHRILARELKVAMQRGYVGRNVATLVDAPSVIDSEIEPLTLEGSKANHRAGLSST